MKISFDAQLLSDREKTGIGWLADNILKELPVFNKHDYQLNYFLFNKKDRQGLGIIEKYLKIGFQLKLCRWFSSKTYKILWNIIPLPYSLFFGKDSDITVFFNYYIPPGVKGRKIVFVHDMACYEFPETINWKTMIMLKLSLKKSCKAADKIITVSQFSKEEIIRKLFIDPKKIIVVTPGIDNAMFHSNYNVTDINHILQKYHIINEYVIYLGTLEPRKNIERLIKAYSMLKRETMSPVKLVIVGRKGWKYDPVFELIEKLGLKEEIIFTGYVPQEDIPLLLCGSLVFMFPSLYEGFGLPPLEAMACGVPVITSNAASLPEVVGDAGILVDPFSVEEIKNAMDLVINDKEVRRTMSQKGLSQAAKYSWKHTAEELMNVFEELI